MDLQEWEILSDDGYVDLHEDHGVNKIPPKSNPHATTVIDMNYFQKLAEGPPNNRLIPVVKFDEESLPEEVTKLPIESSKPEYGMIKDPNFGVLGPTNDHDHDQEMISKVFFKKLKENEFVDMKMDSPKSLNRGILPQIDVGTYEFDEKVEKDGKFEKKGEKSDVGAYQFVEKDEKFDVGSTDEEGKVSSMEGGKVEEECDGEKNDDEDGGLNIWKLAMTGMGALVSFGFAAATVSLIVFCNRHKESKQSKNQELHFQIYSHDKRFKQMMRRASKFNEAISVIRGAPITRAHITIGGYYEGV